MKRSVARLAAVVIVSSLAFVAVGARPHSEATAKDLEKVSVRLAFNYNGHRSPYLLGVDKGFYRDEGLDVSVHQGKGYMQAMQLVANKQDTFAIVDPGTIMFGAVQGFPVRSVVQVYRKSPDSIISWTSAGIKGPKDLVGKTVAVIQGDIQQGMVRALLLKNGVDPAKVQFFAAEGGIRTQVFLSKRTEAINGFYNDSYLGLKSVADDITYFLLADHGIDTMGDVIAANEEVIKASPDTIRAFVRATIRSFKYAFEHPEEAIESLVKVNPNVKPEVELEKLKATRAFVDAEDAQTFGIGHHNKEKWAAVEELMSRFGGLTKRASDVGDYYTNAFIPPVR